MFVWFFCCLFTCLILLFKIFIIIVIKQTLSLPYCLLHVSRYYNKNWTVAVRTQYWECLQQQTSLLLIKKFTAAYMQIEIYRYVNSNIMYLFACSKSTKSYSTQFTQLNSLIGFIAFPSFTHSGAYPCPQTSKLHLSLISWGVLLPAPVSQK